MKDALARLPHGMGTLADVVEMLKASSYLESSEKKLSMVGVLNLSSTQSSKLYLQSWVIELIKLFFKIQKLTHLWVDTPISSKSGSMPRVGNPLTTGWRQRMLRSENQKQGRKRAQGKSKYLLKKASLNLRKTTQRSLLSPKKPNIYDS